MREKLNSNPMVQMAVIGVLLVAGSLFLLTTMGGGGEEGSEETPSAETAPVTPGAPIEGSVEALQAEASAATVTPTVAPPVEPPAEVVDAWDSGATVVLILVRDGGIDDRLVRDAAQGLSGLQDVASFVVPVGEIARYSALTGGVGVERVPALVVLTPKRVARETPSASVHYGYQSPESVVQAVIDAGYEGPTLDYHP